MTSFAYTPKCLKILVGWTHRSFLPLTYGRRNPRMENTHELTRVFKQVEKKSGNSLGALAVSAVHGI